jgi:hypothetical protein
MPCVWSHHSGAIGIVLFTETGIRGTLSSDAGKIVAKPYEYTWIWVYIFRCVYLVFE